MKKIRRLSLLIGAGGEILVEKVAFGLTRLCSLGKETINNPYLYLVSRSGLHPLNMSTELVNKYSTTLPTLLKSHREQRGRGSSHM